MIAKIIDLLQTNDFYNVSEVVEIAKGKHELIDNFSDGLVKVKRVFKYRK